jgi:uncharacterized protein (DUF4415 family)
MVKKTKKKRTDNENPGWTRKDFDKARSAKEVLPELLGKEAAGLLLKKRGRPVKADPKIMTTLRLDSDIIKEFRSHGPGWQSEINNALRSWLSHVK